jgi:hypothetical protein
VEVILFSVILILLKYVLPGLIVTGLVARFFYCRCTAGGVERQNPRD